MKDEGSEYSCARKDIFDKLNDRSWFTNFIMDQSQHLHPQVFCKYMNRRIEDTHYFWQEDERRLHLSLPPNTDESEPEPDHFKKAAHLAYWIRRGSPVIGAYRSPRKAALSERIRDELDIVLRYPNEYMAFDVGYRIVFAHEARAKESPQIIPKRLTHDVNFVRTMCYFLKAKNVSPHAMFLVYKALFL